MVSGADVCLSGTTRPALRAALREAGRSWALGLVRALPDPGGMSATASLARVIFASSERSISERSACSLSLRTRGQHLTQLTHHPALAPVEQPDSFSDIRNGHRLAIEGADLPRRNLAERLDVGLKAPPQPFELGIVDAGAGAARVDQSAIRIVVAEQQRAEPRAARCALADPCSSATA
jgi:hypothetical protein